MLDVKIYCEALLSTKPGNLNLSNFDRSIMPGIEIGKYSDQLEVAVGASLKCDFDKPISLNSLNIYFTFKYHWCRN
jgi:hypothetical protein